MSTLKRTPLYDEYKKAGIKMVEFSGWELPVQFSSIQEEHRTVRTKAGLFDVSHMGEIRVQGINALSFLQKIMTNDVAKLMNGQVQYSAMCDEYGGTMDDLLIYRKTEHDFMLVTNASNTEKDLAWMERNRIDNVICEDVSANLALLALQGPLAEKILQKEADYKLSVISFFRFTENVNISGVRALVSRTGYTGEDGFELYCAASDAARLWRSLLDAGKEEGLLPCGLGARDTLRFEANLPLYGQELTRDISPLEAGIGFAVKMAKAGFIGKDALMEQKENGLRRKIVGIEMVEKGIPRTGYEIFAEGRQVGIVTSGTHSPYLKRNIGLALIDVPYASIGAAVEVQIRKKRLKAKVVATPFYNRKGGAS
ncbi:glycine cleavage system aminomethyltransferase GcvT [bacterium LRH843]|nr:glycine cleavage system aminomethyltransferase GcvT [bacterium LRH843]